MAKKKVLELLAPGLRTDHEGICRWNNSAFTVAGENCKSSLLNGIVS